MKFWKMCAGVLVGVFCSSSVQAGLIFTVKEVGPNLQVSEG
jgi:outer membrane lipoprotein-sorting protein